MVNKTNKDFLNGKVNSLFTEIGRAISWMYFEDYTTSKIVLSKINGKHRNLWIENIKKNRRGKKSNLSEDKISQNTVKEYQRVWLKYGVLESREIKRNYVNKKGKKKFQSFIGYRISTKTLFQYLKVICRNEGYSYREYKITKEKEEAISKLFDIEGFRNIIFNVYSNRKIKDKKIRPYDISNRCEKYTVLDGLIAGFVYFAKSCNSTPEYELRNNSELLEFYQKKISKELENRTYKIGKRYKNIDWDILEILDLLHT
jgi:hypothetical protein